MKSFPGHRAAHHGIFLSLYGGVGRVADALARHGMDGCIIDLDGNPANDVTNGLVQQDIDVLLDSGHVSILGIEVVCSSWSQARRAPRWSRMPHRLRTAGQFIMGLPGLSESEKLHVKLGNKMYRHAIRCIWKCIDKNIRGYLEQPATSLFWHTPGIKRLLRTGHAFLCTADMCQYGTQFKKPTTFLFWGVEPSAIKLSRCCMVHNRCSRTGKKHVLLSGISGKRFLTRAAQVYPRDLASAVAEQLLFAAPLKNKAALSPTLPP